MNAIDLKGRVAVITGGARGIGYAVAERFIASGAKVAIWDIDPETTQAAAGKLGDDTLGIVVDLTQEDAVASATQGTLNTFNRIDILINSAGDRKSVV